MSKNWKITGTKLDCVHRDTNSSGDEFCNHPDCKWGTFCIDAVCPLKATEDKA